MEELINEIIKELSDTNSSIEGTLLKAKILAYKINNEQLKQWINAELNGYKNEEKLPEYRKNYCQIIGTMSNGFQRVTNCVIPLFHMDEKLRKKLITFNFEDGISSLESLKNTSTENYLGIRISPEVIILINKNFPINGYCLEDAFKSISPQVIQNILGSVRSRLLEFLLELENQYESNLSVSFLRQEERNIENLMNIHIYGDGNTIISGNSGSNIKISD